MLTHQISQTMQGRKAVLIHRLCLTKPEPYGPAWQFVPLWPHQEQAAQSYAGRRDQCQLVSKCHPAQTAPSMPQSAG